MNDSFLNIELDPEEARKQKRAREIQFQTVRVPQLRLIGYCIICLFLVLNDTFIIKSFSQADFAITATILLLYALLSWLALLHFYERARYLSFTFLMLDVVMCTFCIYRSGGESSWLILLLIIRVADQTNTTFRRVLFFSFFSGLNYLALCLWLRFFDGNSLSWPAEITKIVFLVLGNLYISLTARTAEAMRNRTYAAIRTARESLREVQSAKAKLEEANKVKKRFLTNMNHEMRTPLNSIIGMTNLTLKTSLTTEQEDFIRTARSSAGSLLQMVDDVLEISNSESGMIESTSDPFSLRQKIQDAVASHRARAIQKELAFALSVEQDCPDSVIGDFRALQQALGKLLDNAVKFTATGDINVDVTLISQSEDGCELQFSVRDTGIGISSDVREYIFEAFAREDDSLTRTHGGMGLGLALVTQSLRRLNGKMTLESKLGHGSRFSFTINLIKDKRRTDTVRSLRILVAEDVAVNQKLMQFLLEKLGHKVMITSDGKEVLKAIAAMKFDVILMDIQMPEMDGVTATKIIREIEDEKGGHIPIIALTAHDSREDREFYLKSGMDGFVAKPVDQATLQKTLNELCPSFVP